MSSQKKLLICGNDEIVNSAIISMLEKLWPVICKCNSDDDDDDDDTPKLELVFDGRVDIWFSKKGILCTLDETEIVVYKLNQMPPQPGVLYEFGNGGNPIDYLTKLFMSLND